uniref:Nuclease HARBI1 n=1 Tax=Cacopsylla melanoneura TaxID=428564 RepID=A0A8D8R0E8_9HEMI
MADRLSDFTHEFIKFPTNDELREVHTKFFNMRGFPGVSGVIDIPMWKSKAGGENAEVFRNRKGYFSLNVQYVAGPDMEFYDVVCRWPGSAHDTRIFDSSYVKTRFEEGNIRGLLEFKI